MEKIIFHIDVNSAYLSWEAVYRLKHQKEVRDLRAEISAVAGDMAMRHGIILAKSISAKQYGIKTGETIVEAVQKCPKLLLVPPNYNLYTRCSKAFMEMLREYTPDVEEYSIDEAFMDMTGSLWKKDAISEAEQIRCRIREELGFTVNIGISSNKVLAKMASDFEKPDKVHSLFPWEIKEKMWPLAVKDLFFVGKATEKKLSKLGIHTIQELALSDPDMLKVHLKKHGELIWRFANGIDLSPVESVPPPNKGYGNSTTLPFDASDCETAQMVFLALAETVGSRLRKDGVKGEIAVVAIKDKNFNYQSHQMILKNPTNTTWEIYQAACHLFGQIWDKTPVRQLGIHMTRIRNMESGRQLNLFENIDYEKLQKLDTVVDSIRRKHGADAVMRAVFLGNPIDHMSGGISREKRGANI